MNVIRKTVRPTTELLPGFAIEPLSRPTLDDAARLLSRTFTHEAPWNDPRLALALSLVPERWYARLCFLAVGVRAPRYWIVRESATGRTVGVTGAYELRTDAHEAIWGGWTAVDASVRGRGLGRALFGWAWEVGRCSGKRYGRLYTSPDENERVANGMYDRMGVSVVKRVPSRFWGETWIREVELSPDRGQGA